jgi:GNAT superfamily N-acetyltransferase
MDNKDVFTYSITPEEYMMFRKAVGWAEFPLEQAEEGLKNSYICVIRRDEKPIALGRIVTDHGYVVYIADVIVLPEYQGQGYGRIIMEKLMETINSWLKPGYKMMVTLVSALGKDEFYKKFGFESRPNERFGPGMCQWIGA